MEFCFADSTRIAATDDSARGVYPAPDPYPVTATDSAATSTFSTPTVRSTAITPDVTIMTSASTTDAVAVTMSASDADDPDDVDAVSDEAAIEPTEDAAPASVLAVIEPNADIAEALQHLLQTLPGVASVTTMPTSVDLVQCLTGGPDVSGFGALDAGLADVTVPEIVFLDTGKACDASTRNAQQLRDTIGELRRTLPSTALVLMSVYPDRLQSDLRSMVAACIRKDTSRSELEALITQVRARRTHTPAGV